MVRPKKTKETVGRHMVALGALYIRPKKTKEKLVVQKIKAIKNTRYKVRPKKKSKKYSSSKKNTI